MKLFFYAGFPLESEEFASDAGSFGSNAFPDTLLATRRSFASSIVKPPPLSKH